MNQHAVYEICYTIRLSLLFVAAGSTLCHRCIAHITNGWDLTILSISAMKPVAIEHMWQRLHLATCVNNIRRSSAARVCLSVGFDYAGVVVGWLYTWLCSGETSILPAYTYLFSCKENIVSVYTIDRSSTTSVSLALAGVIPLNV